jgi:DNA-directed RNA polymerase specialized sigma24 family protein
MTAAIPTATLDPTATPTTTTDTPSDAALWRAGDIDALWERHVGFPHRLADRMTRGAGDLAWEANFDAAMTAMMEALDPTHRNSWHPERASLTTWVTRLATRESPRWTALSIPARARHDLAAWERDRSADDDGNADPRHHPALESAVSADATAGVADTLTDGVSAEELAVSAMEGSAPDDVAVAVSDALGALSPLVRRVVVAATGMETGTRRTLADVATELGVTESQARELWRVGRDALRVSLRTVSGGRRPSAATQAAMDRDDQRAAWEALPPEQRDVVSLHLGIVDDRPMSLEDVSTETGLPIATVRERWHAGHAAMTGTHTLALAA